MTISMKNWLAGLALAFLASAGIAQGPEAGIAQGPEAGSAPTEQEKNGFFSRDAFLGDTFGLRPKLETHGFTYELDYTFDALWNTHGGASTGLASRSLLTLDLQLDTEKAGWWDGGSFDLQFQTGYGNGISELHTGDFQLVSNIEASNFVHVQQFWFRQAFANDKYWLKLGKLDANEDFVATEFGGGFSNSSAAVIPTVPMTTYPDTDLGAVFGYVPNERFDLSIGVYQGRPNGGRSITNLLGDLHGPMAIAESRLHYALHGHPGTLRAGFWWNGDVFPALRNTGHDYSVEPMDAFSARDLYLGAIDLGLGASFLEVLRGAINARLTDRIVDYLQGHTGDGIKHSTSGLYVNVDQEIYREHPEDEKDTQGIGLFAQAGWADGSIREVNRYAGLGMQWTGAIPNRDSDVFGVGVFHARFSPDAGFDTKSETAFEAYYNIAVAPSFSLKPDLQYVINPGGTDAKDALVAGFRGEIKF